MKHLFYLALCLCSACSYHIVGQNRGVIPESVQSVSLHASSQAALQMQPQLLRYFSERSHDYQWVEDNAQAQMQFLTFQEIFVPIAYDISGIATSYRLTLRGSLELWHEERALWRSGNIQVQDDVFVLGGPANVDASRQRVRDELERQWMIEAWLRVSSGF